MSEADADGTVSFDDALDAGALRQAFVRVDESMRERRDHLCDLDGVIGDADHGVTMVTGFKAVRAALDALGEEATPSDVLNAAAKAFLNAVGASAGPLYATAFMRGAASAKGRDALDADGVAALIAAMAEGIGARGKAETGDKTMYDAWHPAGEAATAAAAEANASVAGVLRAAAEAADAGARATIGLQARKGRSAKLGERSVGHMDAGAASTSLLLHALAGVDAADSAAARAAEGAGEGSATSGAGEDGDAPTRPSGGERREEPGS